LDSNEIDESDLQDEKHDDGNGTRKKLRVQLSNLIREQSTTKSFTIAF
jgi:hypothetical protein